MPVDNNLFQKNANTSLIAKLIWQRKSISRADIARELGLYRSTVTNITSYLIQSGVVREGNRLNSTQQGGRKAVELTINPDFGCVLGFDIQPSHCRMVILAADGTELWRDKASFGVLPLTEIITKAVEISMNAHKAINNPIIAMSFSIPGIVDNSYGKIINSFPFGVRDLDVREFVNKTYGYPVFIENDANTAAWLDILKNHAWGNAVSIISDFHEEAKSDPEIIGIGAGIGLIFSGKVYRGSHNAAGEFKSITWKEGLKNQSGLDIEVLKRTEDDSDCLAAWIEDTFRSLIPIISVVDVEKIILHGKPFEDREWVMEVLEQRVSSFLGLLREYRCDIVFDSHDECVSASGAAMMCLHNLFSVPDLDSSDQSWRLTWDKTIETLHNQRM
ncbi:MAG: ROK family transcriptional regulator [Spirochaetales bacterium]|nr:ROK family transcriptional regulator [Spirochaetales bacterium]